MPLFLFFMAVKKPRLLVIVGPTASGKSDLAVFLAKKIGGEVVSCDSRQVYKSLNIGTGKITKKEMRDVPHHLLDIASPKKQLSVAQFQKKASVVIQKILKKGKIPILCGGTGFYIEAAIDGFTAPDVPPNKKLRMQLEALPTEALAKRLKKNDPERFAAIDQKNKRRLIRALEIIEALGKVPKLQKVSPYDVLMIGLLPRDLRARITRRLTKRFRTGLITEARRLHEDGLSYKRMNELGLEYRYLAQYLTGKLSKKEMAQKLDTEIWRYAKRQMTWFKKDKRINWFEPTEKKKIEKLTREFLSNRG